MKKSYFIKDYKNIAIIQTAFLGDVALALPLAQAVKNNHPESNLFFISTPQASPLVSCSDAADHIITYDKRGLHNGLKGMQHIANQLIENKVDCIIAPHRSSRTTMLTYYSKPKLSIGFDRNSMSIVYKKRIKYIRHYHEIERNLSLLQPFSDVDLKYKNLDTDFFSNRFDVPNVEISVEAIDKEYIGGKLSWLGFNPENKIILLAPGSVWQTKRWTEEHFSTLARKLIDDGFKIILIGSKDDKELCKRIGEVSSAIDLSGETTIPQTLYLMQIAKLLVTNDSSPTHFAGLVKCPTVTIFGPTTPIFGFGPWGRNDKIVEIDNLKCRPCAIHGSNKCPIKTHECMVNLKPDIVYSEIQKVLSIPK